MNLNDMIERYEVIRLPKRELEIFRVSTYALSVLLFFWMVINTYGSLGIQILYSEIGYLAIFIVVLSGLILSTYIFFNYTFLKHPILVLSPRNIYLGTKHFGRVPEIYDTKIKPTGDMQLVIVKDSHTLKYRVFLEKKILVDLGHFSELENAKSHRKTLQKRITKFYPKLYISAPVFQDI